MPPYLTLTLLLLSLSLIGKSSSLRPPPTVSRRSFVFAPAVAGALSSLLIPPQPQNHEPASAASAATTSDLRFSTSASGIQWADAKIGSGSPKRRGDLVAIDYVMSTTGARYGSKIYGTAETGAPYRWVLGDGTTIRGLEEAVLGSAAVSSDGGGMPPMMPGGVRRIIVPAELAYASLARPIAGGGTGLQMEDCREGRGPGPIPPTRDAFEEYQRFKNIYCNANRPYQPDLVMDIKMYGQRTSMAASQ